MEEYVAYEGYKFTVEWYYDQYGRSQSLDYYLSLSMGERIKLMHLFKRMADAGEIKDTTKFVSEGDKIYAFKPQPDRFLCFFFKGGKIIVTNAFRKKQPKLPELEKRRSLKYKADYELRVRRNAYYA